MSKSESSTDNLKKIKQRVKKYLEDPKLDNLDKEIAYLRSLLDRIEESKLTDKERFYLLLSCTNSLFTAMEKREKVIQTRSYYLELDQLRFFVRKIVEIINKHVTDPDEKQKILHEFRKFKLSNIKSQDRLLDF